VQSFLTLGRRCGGQSINLQLAEQKINLRKGRHKTTPACKASQPAKANTLDRKKTSRYRKSVEGWKKFQLNKKKETATREEKVKMRENLKGVEWKLKTRYKRAR
jgi:hypothetical protein